MLRKPHYIIMNHVAVITCTTWFNIKYLCVLAMLCIYVFRMILGTDSGYFPKQH
jgi:hypothetical protein